MMDILANLTESQLDALKEISHIGMGHAATALSQLLGHPLALTVPQVSILPLADIPRHIGGEEELMAGLYLKIRGDAKGNILILLPRQSVLSIIHMLTGKKATSTMILTEEERSVLKELANILASSYLTALSNLLGVLLIPSIPGLAFDMAGAVVDYLLIELGEVGGVVMIIETRFENRESKISGRLFLLPDPESMPVLLRLLPIHPK